MLLAISRSSSWHIQIASFVPPTDYNQTIFNVLSLKKNRTIHIWEAKTCKISLFALKNNNNPKSIMKIVGDWLEFWSTKHLLVKQFLLVEQWCFACVDVCWHIPGSHPAWVFIPTFSSTVLSALCRLCHIMMWYLSPSTGKTWTLHFNS